MNAERFHDLASGRRQGLKAGLLRWGLLWLETPYAAAAWLRNIAYDRGWKTTERVQVPVVSVGNITAGGTGKTPFVTWLTRWFRAQGVRAAIVSRGYGAQHGQLNDEGMELEQILPDVPHAQQPDRVAASRMAIEEFASQLIVLDDGFQHRRLARDLDIVLLDALSPFGYGHVLPRGLLREPLTGLRRAHVIVLSRADQVDANERARIRSVVQRYAANALWIEAAHRPVELIDSLEERAGLAALADGRWGAFCGIGNPEGFHRTLADCGCVTTVWKTYPDHHAYTRADVEELAATVQAQRLDRLVCTHKDLVKLGVDLIGDAPLWALRIGLEVVEGLESFERLLQPLATRALQVEPVEADNSPIPPGADASGSSGAE